MSDYSRPYSEEDAKFEVRRDRAVSLLRDVKLRDLTVGEMLIIVGMFYHRYFSLGERDVEHMEEILRNKGYTE